MTMTYKSSGGEKYPVNAGEIWAVGDHLFSCGDLVDGSVLGRLLELCPAPPQTLNFDPPYNDGMVTQYRNKAGVEASPLDLGWILDEAVKPARAAGGVAFIEGGVKEADWQAGRLRLAGAVDLRRYSITYYKTRPAVMFAASWGVPLDGLPDFEGVDDEWTPTLALTWAANLGLVNDERPVLDPCAGRGLTARTAAQLGLPSVNHELSRWRMSAAMWSVSRILKVNPTRLS